MPQTKKGERMQRHVMCDIETLGTRTDAVVVSVAAGRFYITEHGQVLYDDKVQSWILDMKEQQDLGRTIDQATLVWWMNQDKEAQMASFDQSLARVSLGTFLVEFKEFVNTCPVWGNGAGFDNVIVRSLFGHFDDDGWPFWKDRCFRTIKDMHDSHRKFKPENKVAHDPTEDVRTQIRWLQAIASENPEAFSY